LGVSARVKIAWKPRPVSVIRTVYFISGAQSMDQQCKNCGQKDSCKEVFKELGSLKKPSILLKVVQAFLLPLIFFIIALAAAEKVLAEKIASSLGKNLLALAAAVTVVFLYLLTLKFFQRGKN
jgi:hypothetical protein